MEFELLYWHWIVFGIALICLEIFVPSFTFLWFGMGAILIGGITLVAPELPFSWQVFLWALSSGVFTVLWFKFLKPMSQDKTLAGLSLEASRID